VFSVVHLLSGSNPPFEAIPEPWTPLRRVRASVLYRGSANLGVVCRTLRGGRDRSGVLF